jgi:hypothetical protein
MGHSAEEKIKILYEDSLADIRDLTGRMESMTDAVVAAAEKVNSGKSILHSQNEKFLSDVNKVLVAVEKIAKQNAAEKSVISNAVHEVLLGEASPMKDIHDISKRFFDREAQATKWLTKATDKMDHYIWHLLSAAVIGGIAGGIVVKILSH